MCPPFTTILAPSPLIKESMKVTKLEVVPSSILLSKLKNTRLLGYGQVLVYANAQLSIEQQLDTDILVPTQRYVLRSTLWTVKELYTTLLSQGVDMFKLDTAVWFWREDIRTLLPLLPPIIEESYEADGRKVWLISDGMHRVYTARKLGKPLNVILVKNASHPYYAYPLDKGWADVAELQELGSLPKKKYRETAYKELFRNYNDVFPGIQKSRSAK